MNAVEMSSSGPWPETEINTASGDAATSSRSLQTSRSQRFGASLLF